VHNGTRLQLRRIPVPRSYDARVSESLARAFLSHNPCFAELTRQRAISYWSCYYRAPHPSRDTYPALTALSRLGGSAAT
jgi:hypothetical protein